MKSHLLRGGALGLLTALLSVVMPAGAAFAHAPACDEGHWPGTVQVQPVSFQPGGAAGYYVWHDPQGWHLRTTTPVKTGHSFTGTIVASGDITVVRQVRDEGDDRVSVAGGRLRFSFDTYNGVDGIDFRVGCSESLTFSLNASGRPVPQDRIWLGATGSAPSNPFTLTRRL